MRSIYSYTTKIWELDCRTVSATYADGYISSGKGNFVPLQLQTTGGSNNRGDVLNLNEVK